MASFRVGSAFFEPDSEARPLKRAAEEGGGVYSGVCDQLVFLLLMWRRRRCDNLPAVGKPSANCSTLASLPMFSRRGGCLASTVHNLPKVEEIDLAMRAFHQFCFWARGSKCRTAARSWLAQACEFQRRMEHGRIRSHISLQTAGSSRRLWKIPPTSQRARRSREWRPRGSWAPSDARPKGRDRQVDTAASEGRRRTNDVSGGGRARRE